jgi:predicted nuclease of predicted toxin-antitoxin system
VIPKLSFLLDANISPETAVYLRGFGCDAKSLIEEGLGFIEDSAVAALARQERRILVTFDLDFGEIYYFSAKKKFGVIVLRFGDQRVEAVNERLRQFLSGRADLLKGAGRKLIILSESNIRIIS